MATVTGLTVQVFHSDLKLSSSFGIVQFLKVFQSCGYPGPWVTGFSIHAVACTQAQRNLA